MGRAARRRLMLLSFVLAVPATLTHVAAQPTASPPTAYRLSMETMERCHQAAMVALKRAKTDAPLRNELADLPVGIDPTTDIEGAVTAIITSHPQWAALLKTQGCAPRDALIGTQALLDARAIKATEGQKPDPDAPPLTVLGPVPPENLQFLQKNRSHLDEMAEQEEAAKHEAGIDDAE